MDLTQIRHFLALARTLNFTRAAEACNVTQPALTKSIQRLEEELGGPLLLRERALTQLTPLGRAMLPLLEQTHAAAERAKEHAAGLKLQASCPLRVGFAPDAPTPPFAPLFNELATRLPGFKVTLAEAGCTGLFDALLHGTLDAAVVTGASALPDRLNRWALFPDALVLLMPPGHPLAGSDPVPLAALDGAAVVCRAAACGMARLLDQARDEHGARPAARHQADTTASPSHAGPRTTSCWSRSQAVRSPGRRTPSSSWPVHGAGSPPATQPSVPLWFEARQRRLRGGGLHRLDHGQADGVLQEAAVPGHAGTSQDDRLSAAGLQRPGNRDQARAAGVGVGQRIHRQVERQAGGAAVLQPHGLQDPAVPRHAGGDEGDQAEAVRPRQGRRNAGPQRAEHRAGCRCAQQVDARVGHAGDDVGGGRPGRLRRLDSAQQRPGGVVPILPGGNGGRTVRQGFHGEACPEPGQRVPDGVGATRRTVGVEDEDAARHGRTAPTWSTMRR